MNPCISLLLSTAPYYREARVTFAWRRTACRMRHCCARRIDKTGGRRKLLRTSTRWAERHPQGVCRIRKAAEPPTAAQQRIIGAEASRIAKSLAASVSDAATQAVDSASVAALRAAGLQWRGQGAGPLAFSWGFKGDILFPRKENIPLFFAPRTVRGTPLPFRAKRKNRTYLAAGSIFRSYSPSSTARRSLTLPSSASSIVWISASRSRLSVPPRGR